MPSQATTRKLSREAVADAALNLLVTDGREAVTMRRLAAALDVGTMTLYGYFRNKDELLDAAVDRASEAIKIPARRGPWRSQLRALIVELYTTLRRYPVALELRARGPMLSPGALRSTNAGMQILAAAGFDKQSAANTWRLLFTYAFGYAAFTPAELSDVDQRQARAHLAALPPGELPHVVEAAPEAVSAMVGDEPFLYGLDVILDGLEAVVSRSPDRGI
jgi:AcrR family transcriptional regulator